MPHPELCNRTPFALSFSFASDEDGRPLLVVLLQATYDIVHNGETRLAEQQPEVSLEGERWHPEADVSSSRVEPACAFAKPATDVVLLGRAQSARPQSTLDVLFRVGPVRKLLRIIGDRSWVRVGGVIAATKPQPFSEMPLQYERAFGGWDRSHAEVARHGYEPRNPVGVGYRVADGDFVEGVALPNIEDPRDLLHSYGQAVQPAGVGFVSADWAPRSALGGSYDQAWAERRRPLLPVDFDRRFFNAASSGLVTPSYLVGDEQVVVENASARGPLAFKLPAVHRPECTVELRRLPDASVVTQLDTVVVDTDNHSFSLTFRGYTQLRSGPHDVRTIAAALTHPR